MFGRKKPAITDVGYLSWSRDLPSPPRHAIVRAGLRHRWRSNLDINMWLRIENTFEEVLATEIAIFVGAIIAAAVGAGALATATRASFADPVSIALVVIVFLIIAISVRLIVGGMIDAVRGAYAHKGDKREGSDTLSLNFTQADKVTAKAQAILVNCFGPRKTAAVTSIRTDREAPYRLIRGLLPVGPFFFRRPRRDQNPPLEVHTPEYRYYRFIIDMSDALCAGLLGMAGARPRLRYTEDNDKPLAKDRYWRASSQELHDTGESDVFLRFHQSVVEAEFPPTDRAVDVCTYKTFAAINNFRCTKIWLLRVTDIVSVLRGDHPDFEPEILKGVYAGLSISPDEALRLLQTGKFAKHQARFDRFQYDTTSEPLGRSILAFHDNDPSDPIMAFDPGRVWPRSDASSEHSQAIVALRRAIHVAACRCTIAVTPTRRDVLLVDNLRVMVRRVEDEPTSLFDVPGVLRDTLAATFPALAGRWLRQIYGFPARQPNAPRQGGALDADLAEGGRLLAHNPEDPAEFLSTN